jgi:hypothetical protein
MPFNCLALDHRHYGHRRLGALLRHEGWQADHKRECRCNKCCSTMPDNAGPRPDVVYPTAPFESPEDRGRLIPTMLAMSWLSVGLAGAAPDRLPGCTRQNYCLREWTVVAPARQWPSRRTPYPLRRRRQGATARQWPATRPAGGRAAEDLVRPLARIPRRYDHDRHTKPAFPFDKRLDQGQSPCSVLRAKKLPAAPLRVGLRWCAPRRSRL